MTIPLDTPVLHLSENPLVGDVWTVKDSFEGVQIFGGTGSGKTSGSGAMIAKSFLQNGYGGLVLTVKPDECEQWQEWAKETGRENNVFVFRPDAGFVFNFLDYELQREESDTETVVDLFMSIIEIANGGNIESKEAYWLLALRQMLRNTIDVLVCASGDTTSGVATSSSLSLPDMYNFILNAPQNMEQCQAKEWQERFCRKMLMQAAKNSEEKPYPDLDIAFMYWLNEFPQLAEKTRSIIVSMFTTSADAFLRGNLKKMFNGKPTSGGTNLPPELSEQGAIIILDLPIKKYGITGRIAQGVYKLIWQQNIERRAINDNTRPVFLWADEAQNFLCSYDVDYQQTARSSRVATAYLSQNISNYIHKLGGENAVDSILGNLSTKIFHANSNTKTNKWASDIFGQVTNQKTGYSVSNQNDNDKGGGSSISVNEVKEDVVDPRIFTTLSNGGAENGFIVGSVIHQAGRIWESTNSNYIAVDFKQFFAE